MTRELSPMEKEVQDHILDIMRDTIDDGKRIIKRLQATVVLLVILLVGTFIYYEWNFKNFLQQYDYENTVTTTTTTTTEANNDNKIYDKNSNIKADISDIKINNNIPIPNTNNKK